MQLEGDRAEKMIAKRLWRKTKRAFSAASEEPVLKLGGFELRADPLNPLLDSYASHPEYSRVLGRMAAAVERKYPDAVFLDIGANVGDTAAIVRGASQLPIVCVEGDPECFRFLERNLEAIGRASAHQVFLGEDTGAVEVAIEKESQNATLIPMPGGRTVLLQALDAFVDGLDLEGTVRVLKLDTEGFDTKILRGARRLLASKCPVVCLEYNRHALARCGEAGIDALRALGADGYESIVFYDAAGRLMLAATLSELTLIEDLHDYAEENRGLVRYFDLCLFHERDRDLAKSFISSERAYRRSAGA